jgi:hypothetical protein
VKGGEKFTHGERREKLRGRGGKKIFTGERAANKRKTLTLKNLHPPTAA